MLIDAKNKFVRVAKHGIDYNERVATPVGIEIMPLYNGGIDIVIDGHKRRLQMTEVMQLLHAISSPLRELGFPIIGP